MLHSMSETRLLSYIELAELLDMTVPSVRNMVRKKCWSRVLSNDGKTVRIHVPVDELPPPPNKPADVTAGAAPSDISGATSASLAILAKHIEMLQAELEPLRATAAQVAALNAALNASRDETSRLRQERDAERERTTVLVGSVAALEATRDALRDERDRLLTREQLRESRSWWPWRRSA